MNGTATQAALEGIKNGRIRYRTIPGIGPGSLLVSTSTADIADNLAAFCEYTGLDIGDVAASPAVHVPLPVWPECDTRRPWPVRPEAMWLPLFWLPDHLAGLVARNAKAGTRRATLEPQWENHVRVAFAMEMSAPFDTETGWRVLVEDCGPVPCVVMGGDGLSTFDAYPDETWTLTRGATGADRRLVPLYDPAQGAWLDICYVHGIDTETEEGRERVAAWLAGAPDEVLDGIDLGVFLDADGRDPMWTVRRANRLLDVSVVLGPDAARSRRADDVYGMGACMWGLSVASGCDEARSELVRLRDEEGGVDPALLDAVVDEATTDAFFLSVAMGSDRESLAGRRLAAALKALGGEGEDRLDSVIDGVATLGWVGAVVAEAHSDALARALWWEGAEAADMEAEVSAEP